MGNVDVTAEKEMRPTDSPSHHNRGIMKFKSILILAAIAAAAVSSAAGLGWASNYKSALKQAMGAGKIVMIDFTASWCVNCHKLDRTTYVDPSVVRTLGGVVPVRV